MLLTGCRSCRSKGGQGRPKSGGRGGEELSPGRAPHRCLTSGLPCLTLRKRAAELRPCVKCRSTPTQTCVTACQEAPDEERCAGRGTLPVRGQAHLPGVSGAPSRCSGWRPRARPTVWHACSRLATATSYACSHPTAIIGTEPAPSHLTDLRKLCLSPTCYRPHLLPLECCVDAWKPALNSALHAPADHPPAVASLTGRTRQSRRRAGRAPPVQKFCIGINTRALRWTWIASAFAVINLLLATPSDTF
eukprot:365187-Chlamydomonas_euryale.AAC.6